MPYNVTATYTTEAAKLQGTYPVDMYVLNASLSGWEPLYYANINQDIVGFSLNATGDLTNNATIYSGLPIERGDINSNTSGEIGELTISVPNTNRVIESIIQNRKYLRGRDIHIVSGFARHLPGGGNGGIVDDESGVSWGPTVHGLSLADGSAFLKVTGLDLSQYANKNYKITLTDSAGKKVTGYIGAVDAVETLSGTELLNNPGFETLTSGTDDDGTSDNFANWLETNDDANGEKVEATATAHGGSRAVKLTKGTATTAGIRLTGSATAGKLYKLTFWTRGSSGVAGRFRIYDTTTTIVAATSTGVTSDVYTQVTRYVTASAGAIYVGIHFYAGATTGNVAYFDDVSIQEVTHVGATGVHIISTAGGITRNWTSIESGFNYNDSSYTFDITYNIGYVLADKYLGITPDKNAFLKEKMYIDSVTSNEQAVTFNCKSKFNIKNIVVPKRAYYKECTWAIAGDYLGSSCDPQETINTASYPTCDGTLDNCRKRHNSPRFGGFPSIPRRGIIII